MLLGALAVAALADWVCVHRGFREGERLATPAFTVLLLALAWLLGADLVGYGRWLLIGLVASLVADLFLLGDTEERFRAGLGSFLAVHLAYLAMVLTLPSHGSPLWVAVVLVALTVGAASYRLILPLVREVPGEGIPVLGYALALALFAMAAWWHGRLVLALGATLFLVSDLVLGVGRLLRPVPHGRVVVMVTYHLAQLLIVLGVLR